MEILKFNTSFSNESFSNKDVLSVFKNTSEKNTIIKRGMSIKEISDLVSEKIITIVKEQFEETKKRHESGEEK